MKTLALAPLLAALLLGGCYNPRNPGDSPGTERPTQEPVTSSTGGPAPTGSAGQPVMSSGDERRR